MNLGKIKPGGSIQAETAEYYRGRHDQQISAQV